MIINIISDPPPNMYGNMTSSIDILMLTSLHQRLGVGTHKVKNAPNVNSIPLIGTVSKKNYPSVEIALMRPTKPGPDTFIRSSP